VWIKAKPEWARAAQMARITPRFNAEINSYWMCDIGRFDYHWVEGDRRLVQPLVRASNGVQQPVNWHDVWRTLSASLAEAAGGSGVEKAENWLAFLASAHASLEDFHVLKQLAAGTNSTISVSWKVSTKAQPEGAKFKVPRADAPNINGARDLGLRVPGDNATASDLEELRAVVDAGKIKALYVFDPGFPGSMGDMSWIVAARESGRLPLLIVHGVVHSELTAAADFVLPGSTSFEKDASYTNDQGKVQGAAAVIIAPGDAQNDCAILSKVGMVFGLNLSTPDRARSEIAAELLHLQEYGALHQMMFSRPVAARTWLQMSNPSERWKWDFLFQDVPPVKGALDPSSLPAAPKRREDGPVDVIRLKPVE
jgi:NADH-quinone oxidoreductase subunit G